MSGWWHSLTPGEQLMWGALLSLIGTFLVGLAVEWVANGGDPLDETAETYRGEA